jgi:hypothetical protein
MAEITEAEVREFLLVQHIDLVDISVAHAFAQAWLDHEAQVAELQEQNYLAAKENECERQATRDAQAVMERCEAQGEWMAEQQAALKRGEFA